MKTLVTNTMYRLRISTDGACEPNPGLGSWAAVLRDLRPGGKYKEISGVDPDATTNNRMELHAVIAALSILRVPCEIEIRTDSAYVCNAFKQRWIDGWIANEWITSSGKNVANQDLWKQILELSKGHHITWRWVKGHANDKDNCRCDELCTQARQAYIQQFPEKYNQILQSRAKEKAQETTNESIQLQFGF